MMIVLKLLPGCSALHTFRMDTAARVPHCLVPFGDLVWYHALPRCLSLLAHSGHVGFLTTHTDIVSFLYCSRSQTAGCLAVCCENLFYKQTVGMSMALWRLLGANAFSDESVTRGLNYWSLP